VGICAKVHLRLAFAPQQPREIGIEVHRLALGQVDQDRRHVRRRIGEVHAVQYVGLVLARGEPSGLAIRSHFGQRVDGGAPRGLRGGGIGMDRNEKVRPQTPRNAIAFLQHQEGVGVARQRHAHAAGLEQFVANGAGDLQCDLAFARPVMRADRARIVAAMPRIDHHQRAAVILGPFDPGQRRRLARLGQRNAHAVAALRRFRAEIGGRHERLARGIENANKVGRSKLLDRQGQAPAIFGEGACAHHRRPIEIEHDPRGIAVELGHADVAEQALLGQRIGARGCALDVDRDAVGAAQDEAAGAFYRIVEVQHHLVGADFDIGDLARLNGHGACHRRADGGQPQHGPVMPPARMSGPVQFHDSRIPA